MAVGEVDGEPVVIILRDQAGEWKPFSIIRIEVAVGRVVRIADYLFCQWVLPAATSVVVEA